MTSEIYEVLYTRLYIFLIICSQLANKVAMAYKLARCKCFKARIFIFWLPMEIVFTIKGDLSCFCISCLHGIIVIKS